MLQNCTIDLRTPPNNRWVMNAAQIQAAKDMIRVYYKDMDGSEDLTKLVYETLRTTISEDHFQEIASTAEMLDMSPAMVLLCNSYYDLVKAIIGCTAFAYETETGPVHARNLDWHTENRLLNDASMICQFTGAPAGDFVSLGWPGYLGVLSGMAPKRFAITLNAVLSDEPPQIAMPISFLIRETFEQAQTYAEAVSILSETTIPCDCLLLVTGVQTGEMVVIERTPTKFALRGPENGYLHVANDYRIFDPDSAEPVGELQATSCGRFERMGALLASKPTSLSQCFEYLNDPKVIMNSTVQQMVFQASTGAREFRIP